MTLQISSLPCKQKPANKIDLFSMQVLLIAECMYLSQIYYGPDSQFLLLHTQKPPTQLFPILFSPS